MLHKTMTVASVRTGLYIPKTTKRLQRAEASSVVLLSDEDMDFIQFAMGEVCSAADEGFLNRLAFVLSSGVLTVIASNQD